MGAQACMTSEVPISDTTRDVGSTVSLSFQIMNCGDTSGNFHMFIRKNNVICDKIENFTLAKDEYSDVLYCEFTMPNLSVIVKYTGGHSEDGIWIEDYEHEIIISPAVTVCDQPVTVVDEDGVKIDNARVDCYEGASFKAHCTTYYGECLLSFLDIGTQYKAVASKEGYECLNCEKYFTACTSEDYPGITLSLKKTAEICNQSFIVKDTSGNTITENCTIVVREGTGTPEETWRGECATGTDGKCAVTGLIKGKYLKACIEQAPTGYETISESCQSFTACTTDDITLKLKRRIEESWKTVSEPYWVDNDAKIDYEGQNLAPSVIYEGLIKVPTAPIINSHGTQITSNSPVGYDTLSKSWLESFGCTFPLEIKVHLQDENGNIKDTVTRTIPEPTLTCTQTFNIKDKDTEKELIVDTVSVDSKIVTRIVTVYTVTIDKGGTYTVKATKAGYNDLEESFTEDCLHILTFYMTPIPKRPYTITITVKDEKGNPIEGAYVTALKQITETSWKEIVCQNIVVYAGECTTDEWKGYGNLLKTNSSGIVNIGLDTLPGSSMRYGFHAGRPGYLNESLHEDWSEKFETTRRQGENGEGEYAFEFTLTFITVEDKFVVHTKGLKEGDEVWCCEQLLPKCLLMGTCYKKTPDAYPDGKVEFTTADGLTEGNLYGIGAVIHWVGVPLIDTGPSYCGDFKGIREITIYRYGVFGMACELLGIDSASDECRRFWSEMIDPVYCANCITGVLKGEDVHGAEYHPGKFELAMFPVVVLCSALPMVPGAKITNFLGRFFKKAAPAGKHGDDILAVRKYFEDDYLDIYRIQVYGDEVRLKKWADAIDAGDVTEAKRWANDILANPAVTDAVAVGNFNSWLDELTKQIDNIDPKQVDEIADLRIRVLKAADACMDDVTDFTKVYDEKYIELIDVTRRGSGNTAVSTFVRAADCLCSPSPWHCKFSFLNAFGEVSVGAEKLDLWDITAVLHRQGLLDETKYVYKNIIKAFAHADESQIRALRLALEADNYDEVIRLLHSLPKVDMDPSIILSFYKHNNEKALGKWGDRAIEILDESKYVDEEMGDMAWIANNKIDWYRFERTDNYLENFFYNTLTNLKRGEHVSQVGADTIAAMGANNPRVLLEAISKIEASEFSDLMYKLSTQGYKSQAEFLRKFNEIARTPADEWAEKIASKSEWCEMGLPEWAKSLGFTETALKGMPSDVAELLIKEFPDMSAPRIVNEIKLLTPEFKAADHGAHWASVKEKAIQELIKKRPALKRHWAEYVLDRRPAILIKEILLYVPRMPWYKSIGIYGLITTWYGLSFLQAWSIEEMPQTLLIDFQTAFKNKEFINCERILAELKIELEEMEKLIPFLAPPLKGMATRWLNMHKLSFKNKLYLLGLGSKPTLKEEAYITHVRDIIDGDTIATGLTEEDLEARADYFEEWAEKAAAGEYPAGMDFPLYSIVRLAGYNSPDVKAVAGTYESCRIEVVGSADTCRDVTKWAYNETINWLHTALDGKDITLYIDPTDQYDIYRRLLAVAFYRGEDMCKKATRNGVGEVFFYSANKYVDVTGYKNAEILAKADKLIVWNPQAIVCPATGAFFNYYPRARAGETITFEGHATGCADSEITDWKWIFPHDVEKTGRVVTHVFLPGDVGGSFEIHLKICAESIDKHRSITVTKVYTTRVSPCPPFGDVDGDPDGYVNDTDAKLVSDYIDPDLGWGAVMDKVATGIDETEFKRRADVGNDGEVTQDDVNKIYEFYMGADTGRNSFPVCPGKCPTPSVDFSVLPSSPEEGEEVLFTCKSSGGNGYSIVKRKWDFGDGDTDVDNHGVVTHRYSNAGKYDVWLTVTNDCEDGETGTKKKTITVSGLPQPKGNLTIKTYATRDFATADPIAVETFYIDDAIVSGTYSCSKTGLLVSENPHKVKIDFKEAPHTCYADKLDECFDTCEFYIDVVADVTTVVQVCPARSCIFSSNCYATIYVKPADTPDSEYEEVSGAHLMPLGTYVVKFVNPSYSTVVGYITVGNSGVVCENVSTPPTGVCYSTSPPEPVETPGIYVSGFIVKGLLKTVATKTVTFDSVPPGATVSVLD